MAEGVDDVKYLTETLGRQNSEGPVFTAGLIWLAGLFVSIFDRLPQTNEEIESGTLTDAVVQLAGLGPVVTAVLIASAAWFLGETYGIAFRTISRRTKPYTLEPVLSALGGSKDVGSELTLVERVALAEDSVRDYYQLLLDRWRDAALEVGQRQSRLQQLAWITPPTAALSVASALQFEAVTWWMSPVFILLLAAILGSAVGDLARSRRNLRFRFKEASTRQHGPAELSTHAAIASRAEASNSGQTEPAEPQSWQATLGR